MTGWRYIVVIIATAITWLIVGISIGWRHGKCKVANEVLDLMEYIEKEKK